MHTRGIELIPVDVFSYTPYERADELSDAEATATFIVNYSGFTPQAQAAFQFAVNIWADIVVSPVPIRVDARFASLGDNTLGRARASAFWANFPNAPPNTYFADAVADKFYGSDICAVAGCSGDPDIEAEFNSVPPVPWYFGLDARPPAGTVDFVSVVLHELGHGLGFIGSGAQNSGGLGVWGLGSPPRPISYDRYVRRGSGTPFISNPTPSGAAGTALTSNDLFFTSPPAFADAISTPAKLYAPAVYRADSTYSHFDEDTYGPGNPNALMTPFLNSAEANHNPGPLTRELFTDIGWGPTGSGPPPSGVPGRPTVTSAQVSGGVLRVAWSPGAGATPTAHRLTIFAGGVAVAQIPTGGGSSIDIPLPPGVQGSFTVTVTPFIGSTPGPASDPFAFTIGGGPGCTAPPPSPVVTGGIVNATATVNWTSPGATSYLIQAGTVPGSANIRPLTNVGTATSISAPGLPPGFQVWVRVFADNACGRSAPTDFLVR